MSTGRFKKIWDRNDLELEATIEEAREHCGQKGLDFFKILSGIDAYIEKRKRKDGMGLQQTPESLPLPKITGELK